jgi:hypothetical protein
MSFTCRQSFEFIFFQLVAKLEISLKDGCSIVSRRNVLHQQEDSFHSLLKVNHHHPLDLHLHSFINFHLINYLALNHHRCHSSFHRTFLIEGCYY